MVVGIDPGTTLGYAILDLEGNLVKIDSSKLIELKSLINIVVNDGNCILVGTDKKRAPFIVDTFSTKIGARLIYPEEDLLIKEKKELTKNYYYGDDHQRDALASALFALKKITPLLRKIDDFVQKNDKEKYEIKLKELMIKREDLHPWAALEIIEKPEKKEVVIIKKAIENNKIKEENIVKLFNKIKELEQDVQLLKKQNSNLKYELEQRKKRDVYLEKKIDQLVPDEKLYQQLRFKEDRIISLSQQLKGKQDEIDYLNKEIKNFYFLWSHLDNHTLVKKLNTLGWNEFQYKNNILNLKDGDLLLVNDPNVYSHKTIEFLKRKNINKIMVEKDANETTKKELTFLWILKKDLEIKENKYFALVNTDSLNKRINDLTVLKRIIEDYQKERAK